MHNSQIIGYRKNGCPIRVIRGASETAVETTVTETEKTTEPVEPASPPNPDVVKLQAALDKEREKFKAADKRAKELDSFRVKAEELESASKTELERAVDAARKEGESSALQRANSRLVSAEARALAAAQQFRDATDAVRFLDLAEVQVSDDGTVDTGSLAKQLEQLAKDKPYLLAEARPTRPQGDVGQGPRMPAAPEIQPGLGRLRAAYEAKTTKP
jgi:hypothetical protein